MRYPQVLVYEADQRIAAMLEEPARRNRWVLRQPRRPEECRELLRAGGPAVLVLRVGRHLEHEMTLLESIAYHHPDVGCVVVGEAAQAPLAGLAWDVGADYVLILPQVHEMLPEIVAGLMRPRSAGGGG